MMTPFHAGDRVYVKQLGTVSRISFLACAKEGSSEEITIVGFRLGEEIGAGLFSADQLELVAAGEARRLTKAHLDGSG